MCASVKRLCFDTSTRINKETFSTFFNFIIIIPLLPTLSLGVRIPAQQVTSPEDGSL